MGIPADYVQPHQGTRLFDENMGVGEEDLGVGEAVGDVALAEQGIAEKPQSDHSARTPIIT
jgi:hypothetical protein